MIFNLEFLMKNCKMIADQDSEAKGKVWEGFLCQIKPKTLKWEFQCDISYQ